MKKPAIRKALKQLPDAMKQAALNWRVRPTRFILVVSVAAQRMMLFEKNPGENGCKGFPHYEFCEDFVVSTSRYGIGQVMHSNRTPLGLHRVAQKIGGGQPVGTVFKARKPIGLMWDEGQKDISIVHRILWLEGLEPGFNRGGNVDTFRRYVYIHGYGDETTLGRPQSCGCVHVSAADLIPLYRKLPVRTLVWIAEH